MTLEQSVLLLALGSGRGLCAAPAFAPEARLRRGLQALCIVMAVLSAAYTLLTLLFVWAAGQKL